MLSASTEDMPIDFAYSLHQEEIKAGILFTPLAYLSSAQIATVPLGSRIRNHGGHDETCSLIDMYC